MSTVDYIYNICFGRFVKRLFSLLPLEAAIRNLIEWLTQGYRGKIEPNSIFRWIFHSQRPSVDHITIQASYITDDHR